MTIFASVLMRTHMQMWLILGCNSKQKSGHNPEYGNKNKRKGNTTWAIVCKVYNTMA